MNKLEKTIYNAIGKEDCQVELKGKDGATIGFIDLMHYKGTKKEFMNRIDTRKEKDGSWSLWISLEDDFECWYTNTMSYLGICSFTLYSY